MLLLTVSQQLSSFSFLKNALSSVFHLLKFYTKELNNVFDKSV